MNGNADLIRRFEYDLWANLRWMAYLDSLGWPEVEKGIFQHVLSAQEIWLIRFEGTSTKAVPMPMPPCNGQTVQELFSRWRKVLEERDLDEVISFQRITGESFSMPLGDIARHVQNHGTYHRGELRGLCRTANRDDFPETDMARFFMAI